MKYYGCQYIVLLFVLLVCFSCKELPIYIYETSEKDPQIFPDYKNITIPYNIAPLNFSYMGDEPCCLVIKGRGSEELQIRGENGFFSIPKSKWEDLMQRNKGQALELTIATYENNKWVGLLPFMINVAPEPIDNNISYRLIPPGYEGWKEMGIYQRDLNSYKETAILENKLTKHNCLNCHSFCMQDPEKMLFHVRAEFEGTVLIQGKKMEMLNTKTKKTIGPFVYPYWHPSGKYIAFSVNKTMQDFFNNHPNRVEVYDTASDIVIYNVENHKISQPALINASKSFETFPTFSPDGKSLYFCSANAVDSMPYKYKEVKYSLCRVDFDPLDMSIGGIVDTLYNAPLNKKSVSFPRISPDGKFLVFTLHEFGNFSIWHKDSDLYIYNLETDELKSMEEANSDDVESYHSWSSNSRWMIFSSRRTNGLYTRLFITYVEENGTVHKPFLLPQKNPLEYYKKLMFSYNIPEFIKNKVDIPKNQLVKLLRNKEKLKVDDYNK